jgi:hypothetical protein
MSQYTKFQSVESGPFSNQLNRLTFKLPAGVNIDMNESYINLNTRVLTTGGDPGSVSSVRTRYLQTDGEVASIAPRASALVKRSRLSCQTFGLLEEINRPDIFFSNIQTLENSIDEMKTQFKNPIQVFDYNNQVCDPHRELHIGTQMSLEKSAPLRLPMNQCLMLGSKVVNGSDLGEMTVELELQISRWSAEQLLGAGQNFGNVNNKEFDSIAGVGTYNSLVSKVSFKRDEDIPYFVGQSLAIVVGTSVGGIVPPVFNIIESVSRDGLTGLVTITFTDNIAVFAAETDSWDDISIDGRNVASTSLLFDSAEMVVKIVQNAPPMKKITYSTITTEIDNALSQKDFEKQYQLEPTCFNLWVMTPNDDEDLSSSSNATDYRMRVNNVDKTNRNVDLKTSTLYLDEVGKSMRNTGRTLKNTNLALPLSNSQDETETFVNDVLTIITTPIEMTAMPKPLNLQVNSSGNGLRKVILFKEVMKSF